MSKCYRTIRIFMLWDDESFSGFRKIQCSNNINCTYVQEHRCYSSALCDLFCVVKERHNRTWHVAMTFMSLRTPFGAIWHILSLCIARTTKIVGFARKVMFYMSTCILSVCRKCLPWKSRYIQFVFVSNSALYKLPVASAP